MTATESFEEVSSRRRSTTRIVLMSGTLALAICVAFEAWRPAFFLTNEMDCNAIHASHG